MPTAKRAKFNKFERAIIQGMQDTLRHVRGEIKLMTTVYPLPDPPRAIPAKRIAALREKLAMTPHQFAAALNVPPRAVSDWENGKRAPSGAALRLLELIENNPAIAKAILPVTRIRKPMTIQEANDARRARRP